MQKIYKKYQGVAIEDDLAYVSKEFKQFASYFKRRLKMNLEDRGMDLVEFHVGHYDFGGFAEKDGKYVYFSYSCPRYGTPINFEKTDCMEDSCTGQQKVKKITLAEEIISPIYYSLFRK